MALLLLCRRGTLHGNRIIQPLSSIYGISASGSVHRIDAKFFRTGGLGTEGPYDTPQVRQNSASASLAMPQVKSLHLEEEEEGRLIIDQGKKLEADKISKEKRLVQMLTYVTKAYDMLTLPLYSAVQQPWKKLAVHRSTKAVLADASKQEWKCVLPQSNIHMELNQFKIDTLEKLFAHSVVKHGDRHCLGSRQVLGEVEEVDPTGKIIKRYDLGGYEWKTYREVDELATQLCQSFSSLGIKPKQKIAIFAETRAEWLIAAIAAFKLNVPIATVFTTLGDDGVVHALQETEVACLFTSEELMPRCYGFLKKTPLVKNLVYMDKVNSTTKIAHEKLPQDVKVQSLSSLISLGKSLGSTTSEEELQNKPKPDDTAIIMYTSGSTGIPKGVILSHWNFVASLKAVTDSLVSFGEPTEGDTYIAYLPLAHALELMGQAMCFLRGIRIGYSSPLTLTDKSLGVKEGSKGDATLLQPTFLASVPLVIERISKGIQAKVSESGDVGAILFDFFQKYKQEWTIRGYDTPLVDWIFFRRIRNLVGGKVRLVVCGGAPLAPKTQEYFRAVLGCPVMQGYGLTETCASGTMSFGTDLSVGRVGGPISCNHFRLVNWEEGGYRVTDKPYPRGEVYVGGDNVAMGYFKKTDSTDFFVEDGKRWFKTGDIAEVQEDGAFRIIDRKKDLVKLSSGEFVSLGKIEATLKTSPLVENICVCANSMFPQPVAVMVATQNQVEALAVKLGRKKKGDFGQLVNDPVIKEAVLSELKKHAKLLSLKDDETPQRIHICSEIWLPEGGLVTAAFKIKRNNVYKHFNQEIEHMFNDL